MGEPRAAPNGTPLPGCSDRNWWNHVFDYEVETRFFEQMERLLDQLALHKDFFLKIAKEGGNVQLYFNLPGEVNQGDTAKPSMLNLMSELELHLGVELFPDVNYRNSKEYADVKGITFITR